MNIFDSIKNLKWGEVNLLDILKGCSEAYLMDFDNPIIDKSYLKKIATYRLKICATCHMNNDGWCDNTGNRTIINVETGMETVGCGCGLKCGTALLSKECPAALWKSVTK